MKKFIIVLVAMFAFATGVFSQIVQSNYTGSSKLTDNMSVTVQGGVLTSFNNFYSGHTSMAPIVVVGVDKFVNPWFGVGVEGRTLIGTGNGAYNTKTTFDWINVSGYAKFNVLNMFKFDGTRRFFEPIVYTGLGWGHKTTSVHANNMTYRAGAELNFNVDKKNGWGVVVNPSVVWGGMNNFNLNKHAGNFEVTVGVIHYFKTSNGTRTFVKPVLYDQLEVDRLNARIAELETASKVVATKNTITEVVKEVPVEKTYIVTFAKGKSDLTDAAKNNLDKVKGEVVIVASASPEGTTTFNQKLSEARAVAVKTYLENRGIKVTSANGVGVTGNESNRIAIITVQ